MLYSWRFLPVVLRGPLVDRLHGMRTRGCVRVTRGLVVERCCICCRPITGQSAEVRRSLSGER